MAIWLWGVGEYQPTLGDLIFALYNGTKPTRRGPLQTIVTARYGIETAPVIVNGDIDNNSDGTISGSDENILRRAIRNQVATSYTGPAILDYEDPYRADMNEVDPNPELTDAALASIFVIYRRIYAIALEERPNAQWGTWSLPKIRLSTPDVSHYNHLIATIGSGLLREQRANFISIYDDQVGDSAGRYAAFVARMLECTGGMPTWLFVRGRYIDPTGHDPENPQADAAIPTDEFLAQVQACLTASWNSHRPQGVIWFDDLSGVSAASQAAVDAVQAARLEALADRLRALRGLGRPLMAYQ